MKYFRKKKKKKKFFDFEPLSKIITPLMIICLIIFIILAIIFKFNKLAIILLALVFAGIPNFYNLYSSYKKRQRYLNMDFDEIDNLTGIEFEELLSTYYKSLGYTVEDTPKVSDYGADLILTKNGKRYVLQAKRYKEKVGVKAVQEVVASKAHYNATGAIVATNNFYTQNAWNLAKENHVFLIDRAKLIELKDEVDLLQQNK